MLVDVEVWTSSEAEAEPIEGVQVKSAFSLGKRSGVRGIIGSMNLADARGELPTAIVLQFNQFSWGKWGLNLYLPRVMQEVKRRWPQVRIAVMFHEKIVPADTWKFRVMRLWQTWQYNKLADAADLCFYSIQRWADEERLRSPGGACFHLPVGSNLPDCIRPRNEVRNGLGLSPNDVVLGVFGGAHPSRLIGHIAAAVEGVWREYKNAKLLIVGSGGGPLLGALRAANCKMPAIDVGYQLPAPASEVVASMDLMLAPFSDGLTTRRGSAMAALQQGVALLSTDGRLTGEMLRAENERSLLLTPAGDRQAYAERAVRLLSRPEAAGEIGLAGEAFYRERFDWPVLARKLSLYLIPSRAPDPQDSSSHELTRDPC
ncbi:MAG: glycosyltransferase [Pseudomonadota bacterium]